ncbi:ABC transporter ATP-binding protein [Candidatus Altiarchaeota archaeon]
MGLIRFDQVSKVYTEGDDFIHSLDDASFTINEGEFVAIMGPSGSGKSTLLSILGVLNTPTGGSVFVDDIAVYDLDAEKRADFRFEYMGFVFQSFQLVPYLTVEENVMLPLAISGIPGKEQRQNAEKVLHMVGIYDKGGRLPSKISGGEGQRVAIARAIVNDPPILLADEPTGNLDSKNGAEIIQLLRQLNTSGQTIVMVTHDPKMAEHADRTINLMDGRVIA